AMFFDVDGTIISEITGEIPESARKALQMAKDQGHYIFMNTGRTLCNIDQELHAIGFDGLLCGCGTYITFRDQVIRDSHIPVERGIEIAKALEDCHMGILLEGKEELIFQRDVRRYPDLEGVRQRKADLKIGNPDLYVEDYDYEYDKLLICTDEESNVEKLYQVVGDELDIIDRHHGALEIVQKGLSKATAMEEIRVLLGLDMDDLYVFGDSSNDITMFEYADHTIAMGKHDPELEPLTEYVTDTVENDGLYKAMKHFGFI
ncbi:MAG: Cof-type HAD-IIB family hydrolase, partial [Dorea sp.]|nr:Cof-type HAD-IIB family hydrolase [Dorea sp.]